MAENRRVLAIGAAYVEAKLQSQELHLPARRRELPSFLDAHPEVALSAGGSIPNVLSTFMNLSETPTVRLLSCVGKDQWGDYFTSEVQQVFGKPKRSKNKPTGLFVGIYNNGLKEASDSYGASYDFSPSRRELKRAKSDLFITDISTCKDQKGLKAVQKTIARVKQRDGMFALSLGGAIPTTSTSEQINDIFHTLDASPDLVFGNERELLHTVGGLTVQESLPRAFPNSKLVIITRAENGSVIKYEDQVIPVPISPIPAEKVIDETGAGDSFMGATLALLLQEDPDRWTFDQIFHAARVASFASSLVIQSMQSRVTPDMATQVRAYEKEIQ